MSYQGFPSTGKNRHHLASKRSQTPCEGTSPLCSSEVHGLVDVGFSFKPRRQVECQAVEEERPGTEIGTTLCLEARPLPRVCSGCLAWGGLRMGVQVPGEAGPCWAWASVTAGPGHSQAHGPGAFGRGKRERCCQPRPASPRRPASMSGAHKEPCHASAGKGGPGGTGALSALLFS